MVRTAQRILERRRSRTSEFDDVMFGEPAWDMLLDLYVREAHGASTTASQLLEGTGARPVTASRWLQFLEEKGLASRRPHPLDQRVEFVALTGRARDSLDRYLSNVD